MSRSIVTVVAVVLAASAMAAGPDLKPILDPYLQVQQALNADSIEGLKEPAGRLASAAAALETGADPIRAAAARLRQASDLAGARAAFGALSEAIIAYAKQSGVALGDGVKTAYCPMARKHWLQKEDEIRNPYYGKQMSECGRFVTIDKF